MALEGAVTHEFQKNYNFGLYFRANGNHDLISYSGDLVFVQPGFIGTYHDMLRFSVAVGAKLFNKNIKMNARVIHNSSNILIDHLQPSAPISWSAVLNSSFSIPTSGPGITVGWQLNSRRDRLPEPAFNYYTNDFSLGIRQEFSQIDLNASGRLSFSQSRIDESPTLRQRYSTGASYAPPGPLEYTLNLDYDYYGKKPDFATHRFSWKPGLRLGTRIVDLGFNINNSFSFDQDGLESSNLGASLDATVAIGDFSNLTISGSYLFTDRSETPHSGSASIRYSASFGVPISRKQSIGSIKGTVVSSKTGVPLQNIIIRTGADAAVTDEKGRFFFSAVKPGISLIDVDATQSDTTLQPFSDTPIAVEVEGKKTATLEVQMGRRNTVTGTVMKYAFPPEDSAFMSADEETDLAGDDAIEYIRESGAQGMLLEITNGEVIYRRLTSGTGEFSFDDLIPGTWELSVYDYNLPEYHFIEEIDFVFELTEGDREEVEIRLLPLKRTIKFIDEGVLSL